MEIPFPPQCRARYRPEKLLASGGFGAVYLATQVNLDRRVAIKLLKSDMMQDGEQVERFLAEARITASLSHPNVVTILDHAVEDGVPWIAYEFLPGRNVRALLENGPLAPRDALAIASQVAGALGRAHAQSILHRDIKPENVLEAEPGFFKVTDFGIAKWTRDGTVKTRTGVLMGTPLYMAPELISGATPGAAADQYALGIMLHELLVGAPPFVADHPMKILVAHIEQEPSPPSSFRTGLPPQLDAVVRRTLEKDPARRFASCLEFKTALDDLATLFPAGRAVGASGVVRRPVAPQATAAAPVGAQATAPASIPPQPTAATRSSGAIQRPSRKIVSTVATPAPAADRRPLIAGGMALALALGGAFVAMRPKPVPSPVATPAATVSPSADSPMAAPVQEVPVELRADIDPMPLVVSKMKGTLKLFETASGIPPLLVWSNLQLLVQGYIAHRKPQADEWFDAALQQYEIAHGGNYQYWLCCLEWRRSCDRFMDAAGWTRVTHDALACLLTMRQPLEIGGKPCEPFGYPQLSAWVATCLRRDHHWREPRGNPISELEWKARAPLHVLASYASVLRRRAGDTKKRVNPGYDSNQKELVKNTGFGLLKEDASRAELAGLKALPSGAKDWLDAIETGKQSPEVRRMLLARAVTGCLVVELHKLEMYPPAASADDPLRALVRLLIRADFPTIADDDGPLRLARIRLSPHPALRRNTEPTPDELTCIARLDAMSLSGLLADWLFTSLRAVEQNPALARPLARALLEALEWQLAFAAGTVHENLRSEAIAELIEMSGRLKMYLEKSDHKRVAELIAAAR